MSADILTKVEKEISLGGRMRKLRKRGVNLVEAAAVLAISAVVIAGGLQLYNMVDTSRKISQAQKDLNVIQQSIRSIYAGQSSFNGITAAALVSTKVVPASMVSGTTLRHAFNGQVNIESVDAGGGNDSGFRITFTNVPAEACVKLLTSDYGRSLYEAGATTKRTQSSGLPFNPVDAATSCAAANNTITWTFT